METKNTYNAGYRGIKSFVEVVRGRGVEPTTNRTIKVYEEVVRLKASAFVDDFREELVRRGCGDTKVRLGGGRDTVLSFQSVAVMKEQLVLMKEWLYDWCETVLEWRQRMAIEQEIYVWLICYGVPLNLWSKNTFSSIGKDQKTGDTYLSEGVEQNQCIDKGSEYSKEGEDRLRDVSVVAETDLMKTVSEVEDTCEVDSAESGMNSKFTNDGGRHRIDVENNVFL
ncbi:hypothetical protein ACSBR1_013987 [Camellia fascicularis]